MVEISLQCLQVSSSTMKGDGSGLSLPHHMSTDCRMKHTLTVLTELERFLTVPNNPRDRKNRQKLFRNLKVLFDLDQLVYSCKFNLIQW